MKGQAFRLRWVRKGHFWKLVLRFIGIALLACVLPAIWYVLAYNEGKQEFLDLMMEENFGPACHGKLLKVIIETCMLTDAEKIEMCRVVSDSGAEYIKTSTGFGGGGATREDVVNGVSVNILRSYLSLVKGHLGVI